MKTVVHGGFTLTSGILVALTSVTSACIGQSVAEQPSTAASAALPTAQPVPADPRVGAIYVRGEHLCSGAVLDSPAGDLILTAGHCTGMGPSETFVAGLDGTAAPKDVWHIDTVYLDPRWIQFHDPMLDFAIARVSRETGGSVEAYAGGGLHLGTAPKPGTAVPLTGYGDGTGGGPVSCRAIAAAPVKGFPEADCAQMLDGTSGAPWMVGPTVSGVTGGLDSGGCEGQTVNYSAPFGDDIKRLLARAETGGPGDAAPQVDGDAGCP